MLRTFKRIRDEHEQVYIKCQELSKDLAGKMDLTNVADTALLLRKSIELLKDSVKELDKLSNKLAASAALSAVFVGDGTIPDGQFAKAHLRTYFSATLPSYTKAPEKYEAVCEALGVQFNEKTRLHFPTIRDHITAVMEKGGQLPEILESLKQHSEVKLVANSKGETALDAALAKLKLEI